MKVKQKRTLIAFLVAVFIVIIGLISAEIVDMSMESSAEVTEVENYENAPAVKLYDQVLIKN